MVTAIIVHRSHIELKNYQPGESYKLEETLSTYDPLYFKKYPLGRYYDETHRCLRIARGYNINKLEMMFNIQASMDYSNDEFRDLGTIGLKKQPRDADQIEAIKFILGMEQYRGNDVQPRLALNLNTGKGKSYCAISAIAYTGICSAIIAANLDVLNQWESYFYEYTDITPDSIYTVAGTPSIQKLFHRDISKYRVFLFSHATLRSYGESNGWSAVGGLFRYLGIGMKFYDEAHQNFDNMCMIDFFTNTHSTYYLTATPGRSDLEENYIYQIYMNGVPSINLFHEDTDPHTKYASMIYNSKPRPQDIESCKSPYGVNRSLYANYVVDQENFKKIIAILVDRAEAKYGQSLWYVATNEAILQIRDYLYDTYPELVRQVGIFTTLTPKERKKEQLSRKIILTTVKSAGQAIDIPGLVETVNLAEPFKSKVLAQQTLGRTRNAGTVYKDVVDIGFPQFRRFYNFKKPVYQKYATECKEFIYRDNDLDEQVAKIMAARPTWNPITFIDDRNP